MSATLREAARVVRGELDGRDFARLIVRRRVEDGWTVPRADRGVLAAAFVRAGLSDDEIATTIGMAKSAVGRLRRLSEETA